VGGGGGCLFFFFFFVCRHTQDARASNGDRDEDRITVAPQAWSSCKAEKKKKEMLASFIEIGRRFTAITLGAAAREREMETVLTQRQ